MVQKKWLEDVIGAWILILQAISFFFYALFLPSTHFSCAIRNTVQKQMFNDLRISQTGYSMNYLCFNLNISLYLLTSDQSCGMNA